MQPKHSVRHINLIATTLEKYPRGRRGSPAKGVVRESVARVQIPLSPPNGTDKNTYLISLV